MKRISTLLLILLIPSLFDIKGKTVPLIESGTYRYSAKEIPASKEVDIQAKINLAQKMVNDAVIHLQRNSLQNACRDFGHNLLWRNGELFVFVLDAKGSILVHGDDTHLLWKNITSLPTFNYKTLESMLNVPEEGHWIQYRWYNGLKSSFIKRIVKDGNTYVVGVGFFPDSEEYTAQVLAESIRDIIRNQGIQNAIDSLNEGNSAYIQADIGVSIYTMDGDLIANTLLAKSVAHGHTITAVTPDVEKFIKIAETPQGSGWTTYQWQRAQRRAYVIRVRDRATDQRYIVVSAFYPSTTQQQLRSFVHRAIRHMQNVGPKVAFKDFSNPNGDFIRGELAIFVYQTDGLIVAHGEHPDLVGKNGLEIRDAEDRSIPQEILDAANRQGVNTLSIFQNNAHKLYYVEKVRTPCGEYIIGSSFFPSSKRQIVEFLVQKAANFLRSTPTPEALQNFSDTYGKFYRGDVYVFAYTAEGTNLVQGVQDNMIWQNFARSRDQKGRPIVENMISLGRAGGGWTETTSRNALRRVYVRAVEKEESPGHVTTYILGSGYYL